MKHYKVGLLIGRFQPFHKGHLWLIKHAFKSADKLVIGVGSVNAKNQDNPLDYGQRKKILELVIDNENLKDKVRNIVPLDDFYNDKKWFDNTLRQAGQVDVVIGNNEWVNSIFEKRGYPILRVGYYKRYLLEGEKIRRLMREGRKWKNRIPDYLLRITDYELKNEIRNA